MSRKIWYPKCIKTKTKREKHYEYKKKNFIHCADANPHC